MTTPVRTPRRLLVLVAMVLGLVLAAAPDPAWAQSQSPATAQKPLSAAERQAIEDVVKQFILNNPDVVIESIQNLRQRQEREAKQSASANLVKMRDDLLRDPATPVGGNPKGDVTIVEFFDYRCGFCKRVFPAILEVLKTDRNVRLVFKEFPILGPQSVTASRIALAAWLTDAGRYGALHNALMQSQGALPETRVLQIATEQGYDAEALKRALDDPRIGQIIEKNYTLAEALDINGTPAFIIGDEIIRGAIDLGALRQLVSRARGS